MKSILKSQINIALLSIKNYKITTLNENKTMRNGGGTDILICSIHTKCWYNTHFTIYNKLKCMT